MALSNNPYFRAATKEVQAQMRAALSSSTFGKVVSEAQRALKFGGAHSQLPSHVAGRSVPAAISSLRGTQFGELTRGIQRYAKGPWWNMISAVLEGMGPAGKMLKALSDPDSNLLKDELKAISEAMRALGYRVDEPGQMTNGPEAMSEAKKFLGQIAGEEKKDKKGFGYNEETKGQRPIPQFFGQEQVSRGTVADPFARSFSLPPNHPAVTGDMVKTTQSTNVHSIGYDMESQFLYVRFYAAVRGDQSSKKRRTQPGPLYRYHPVLLAEFNELLAQKDHPGEWIWDNLRIRGTWGLHTRSYELVGVMGDYVPRQALSVRNPSTGEREEWFVKRQVKTLGGQTLVSPMKTERAPMTTDDRGQTARPSWYPNRGTPNNGRPNPPNRGK